MFHYFHLIITQACVCKYAHPWELGNNQDPHFCTCMSSGVRGLYFLLPSSHCIREIHSMQLSCCLPKPHSPAQPRCTGRGLTVSLPAWNLRGVQVTERRGNRKMAPGSWIRLRASDHKDPMGTACVKCTTVVFKGFLGSTWSL